MTGPNLPGALHRHPECGACYRELDYDDGVFTCPDCRLAYSANNPENPAEYLDEEDKPCGEPGNPPHERHMKRIHSSAAGTWRFWDEPCSLPTGHTSGHWHYGAAERLTTDKEDDE